MGDECEKFLKILAELMAYSDVITLPCCKPVNLLFFNFIENYSIICYVILALKLAHSSLIQIFKSLCYLNTSCICRNCL